MEDFALSYCKHPVARVSGMSFLLWYCDIFSSLRVNAMEEKKQKLEGTEKVQGQRRNLCQSDNIG